MADDPALPDALAGLAALLPTWTHPGPITPATRREVHERDGWRCQWDGCDVVGTPGQGPRDLQCCHRRHAAVGGSHDPANLLTFCARHHRQFDDAYRARWRQRRREGRLAERRDRERRRQLAATP